MKSRNLQILLIPFGLAGLILLAAGALWLQRTGFEQVYLDEERGEIENHLDMLLLFFQPLLDANDLDRLDQFCDTFAFDQRSVAVYNDRGFAVVASENADLTGNPIVRPETAEALHSGVGIAVRQDPRSRIWTVYAAAKAQSREKTLVIYLTIPAAAVSHSLQKSSRLMSGILIFGLGALLFLSWRLIQNVARPLNRLQQSAEQIAAGDLDVSIEVPQFGAIRDLALSIACMADQLKQKLDLAQRQERFQREFIANVSHEIKTPLTAILSAVDLLDEANSTLDGVADNSAKTDGEATNPSVEAAYKTRDRCRQILNRQVNRLNLLVRDILNLAQLEQIQVDASGANPVFSLVSLKATAETAIRLCTEQARENSIRLELVHADDTTVFGDSRMLEQALVNLISNAIKYSGSGRIEISVEAGICARIAVRDFGVGIPAESAEKVFDRFFRLKKEYSGPGEGSGLGLAIVKSIAAIHGGTVRLVPGVSHGCRFEIDLPIKEIIDIKEIEES